MNTPISLRDIPQHTLFRPGDVFVLFGELFGRGYANGLVNEARKAGMKIVGITVGRRDEGNALRPLNDEELAEASRILAREQCTHETTVATPTGRIVVLRRGAGEAPRKRR